MKRESGNQRARMANSDPPDEINDGEAPSDRDVYAPNAHAHSKKNRYRVKKD
jgi:hypothetical protein